LVTEEGQVNFRSTAYAFDCCWPEKMMKTRLHSKQPFGRDLPLRSQESAAIRPFFQIKSEDITGHGLYVLVRKEWSPIFGITVKMTSLPD